MIVLEIASDRPKYRVELENIDTLELSKWIGEYG